MGMGNQPFSVFTVKGFVATTRKVQYCHKIMLGSNSVGTLNIFTPPFLAKTPYHRPLQVSKPE
jgi:hypothetical protein